MLALGFASYLSLYPALLFIPLVLLCYDQQVQSSKAPNTVVFFVQHGAILLASVAGLLGLSYLVTGNFWEFMSATYGFHLLVPDLTPNVGLWWYFFIEMFDSFREFFLGVFWLHLASYVGGFTARLRRQPLFIITSLLGVFAIFKPYPSISDASLYFALLPLYRHLFPCEYWLNTAIRIFEYTRLIMNSDAIYLFRSLRTALLQSSWPRILPPVDLRWIRQRQLLLCDHSRLESRPFHPLGRQHLCGSQRRMGASQPGVARPGSKTNII